VVVSTAATEIDAAQRPLDDNNDDNGDNDDVDDTTSDCALDDLKVASHTNLDTMSRSSDHDNATFATHHQPSLPATTLPVLTAHGSGHLSDKFVMQPHVRHGGHQILPTTVTAPPPQYTCHK